MIIENLHLQGIFNKKKHTLSSKKIINVQYLFATQIYKLEKVNNNKILHIYIPTIYNSQNYILTSINTSPQKVGLSADYLNHLITKKCFTQSMIGTIDEILEFN